MSPSRGLDQSPHPLPDQVARTLELELPPDQGHPVKLSSRRQIARRFGVSLPTVSAALKELQRRQLIYWVPGKGMYAGGRATGRQARLFSVGVLGWFSHVAVGGQGVSADTYRLYLLNDLMAQASKRGWQVTVIPHEHDGPIDLDNLRHTSLDALLLKDPVSNEQEVRALRRLRIPLLSESVKFAALGVGYVSYDNVAMVRQLVEIFASLGHRRIAYVGVETSSPMQNQLMRQMFFASLVDAGLIYDYSLYWKVAAWDAWRAHPNAEFVRDLGYEYAKQLLALPERPTAVFAWQPQIAEGCARAVEEAGLSIPGGLSLITDAIDASATPFSTFVQPHQQLASQLLDRLKQLVDDPNLRVEDKILKQFEDKGSIARPKS